MTAETGFRETQNFGRLEYSFYKLVKECNIEMSECSLIEENGRAHFLTKRFDRVNGEKIAAEIIDQVCMVVSGWRSVARECGVPTKMVDAIMSQFQLLR